LSLIAYVTTTKAVCIGEKCGVGKIYCNEVFWAAAQFCLTDTTDPTSAAKLALTFLPPETYIV